MSKLGQELIGSMAEAVAHSRGEPNGSRIQRVAVKPDKIQLDCKHWGLSQDQFADVLGVIAKPIDTERGSGNVYSDLGLEIRTR